MEFEFFDFFGALPLFLHRRSETYNYPKMAIFGNFWQKSLFEKIDFWRQNTPKILQIPGEGVFNKRISPKTFWDIKSQN